MASARSYRFARRPAWLAGHLLVLAVSVAMVLLGHWQLTVSDRKHFSLQNFGYALQWWSFTAFALVFWAKVLHDKGSGRSTAGPPPARPLAADGTPLVYRRYVMPSSAPETDPQINAYNEHLRALEAKATSEDDA